MEELNVTKPRVLFLCTGNCCRSPMAEAIGHHVAGDKFEFHSAGTTPAGFIHPLTLETLEELDISTDALESKGWEEYDGAEFDMVITLCDVAAGEPCPNFAGPAVKANWFLPDPSFMPGSNEDRLNQARRLAERLKLKIQLLAQLDLDHMDADTLQVELNKIADY